MPAQILDGGPAEERPVTGLQPWRELPTPSEIQFEIIGGSNFSRTIAGGHSEFGCYAKANEIVAPTFGLPYTPNPRKPVKDSTGKQIEYSASNHPDRLVDPAHFILANNGIDIIGTPELDANGTTLKITFASENVLPPN